MSTTPAGLQRERTALAWRRTTLLAAVVSLGVLRLALVTGSRVQMVAAVAVGCGLLGLLHTSAIRCRTLGAGDVGVRAIAPTRAALCATWIAAWVLLAVVVS